MLFSAYLIIPSALISETETSAIYNLIIEQSPDFSAYVAIQR